MLVLSSIHQSKMDIVDLKLSDSEFVNETANLLFHEFKENWPNAWPTFDSALSEIKSCIGPNKILRVAIESNEVVGCIGGQPQYNGNVWEIHPLAVRNDKKLKGVPRWPTTNDQLLVAYDQKKPKRHAVCAMEFVQEGEQFPAGR